MIPTHVHTRIDNYVHLKHQNIHIEVSKFDYVSR